MSIASVNIEPIPNRLGLSCAYDTYVPADLPTKRPWNRLRLIMVVHMNSVLEIPNTMRRAHKETEPER